MTTPIPQPPSIPFFGNVADVDTELPERSFQLLSKQYGPIYQLTILGRTVIHINSHALLSEISDESRFEKRVSGPLGQVRNLVGDALFTAQPEEPNWGIAHRVLMPAFGPANVRNMFDDMRDVASQLFLKWERFGSGHAFEPADDFTRLAFDTIALCSMSHRLNSFYFDRAPPFTQSMGDFLAESNRRTMRPALVQSLMRGSTAKYDADIKLMTDFAQGIVEHRKKNPTTTRDLLALMLEGVDPKTGGRLSDTAIIHNLLTFLIAGHETTSGMLAFTTYYLLKNPPALARLRAEVDARCGARPVQLADLAALPYLVAVMRESLRLSPTAPVRSVVAKADTTLAGGCYAVPAGITLALHVTETQRDPTVWGDDADEFRPERMLDGKFDALPHHAWQPFGFGMRACIGRPFAWQEAQLVLAGMVQLFDLRLADASYTLALKQSLTIKPAHFFIHAVPRPGRSARIYAGLGAPAAAPQEEKPKEEKKEEVRQKGARAPLHVLYGSNTGTCEAFAQRLASDAAEHGFAATLGTLDAAAERLPKAAPVLIVTASFEGEPADNAAHFAAWLQELPPAGAPLAGVRFAVFGCGSREWARTYQRVPRMLDERLAAAGAERLLERGEADAAGAAFFEDFEAWEARVWGVLAQRYDTKGAEADAEDAFGVQLVDAGPVRAELLRQKDMRVGVVLENRLLTASGAPMKRHIEFSLPEGMSYSAGDYLAILPSNPPETVQRAMARFGLSSEQEIIITSESPTTFPTDKPIPVQQLLSGYVELSQAATTRDLQTLAAASTDGATKAALDALAADYQDSVLAKRVSVLDLLEQHTPAALPFSLAAFLRLLPPMRLRQYSIASSPLADASRAALCVSVVRAPARSGHGAFLGTASNFLAGLRAGDRVQLAVRASGAAFRPPRDPAVPVVMFCAGAGLAPFRGFVQERVAQRASGRAVGPMLLFFGCRAPGEDYLYSDGDLGEWAKAGIVDIRPAFSRETGAADGCKYVQDRIWKDRKDIISTYDAGAKFYTCGSRKAANGVKQACIDVIKFNNPNFSDAEAAVGFDKVQKERYATDIFD